MGYGCTRVWVPLYSAASHCISPTLPSLSSLLEGGYACDSVRIPRLSGMSTAHIDPEHDSDPGDCDATCDTCCNACCVYRDHACCVHCIVLHCTIHTQYMDTVWPWHATALYVQHEYSIEYYTVYKIQST